jgi:hypothetical protein
LSGQRSKAPGFAGGYLLVMAGLGPATHDFAASTIASRG